MESGPKPPGTSEILPVLPEMLRIFPLQFLKQHRVLPLKIERQKLVLAMVNPNDRLALDNARSLSGYEIEIFPTTESTFGRSFQHYFSAPAETTFYRDLVINENIAMAGQEPQVIRVVNRMVEIAVERRASDIHLEPQRKGFFARLRIDGVLNTIHQFPMSVHALIVSRIKIMSGLDISERRLPQDGQFTYTRGNENVGVRVSVIPGNYGEKAVLRLVGRSVLQTNLETLQLPPALKKIYTSLVERPHGLILVTGPTGTGKTTTLYATLKHLISKYTNIITLEDPIEYELLAYTTNDFGVTQIQVNPKVGMTFATGLRSVLRQDPDVIMVGEIRDKETAEITMRAVMTGHMVLSTLHTSDAPSALNRLVEMGIERYLITSSVSLVLAQQLVRLLCLECRQPFNPLPEFLKKIYPQGTPPASATFFQANGCMACFETGYFGRQPLFELLPVDNEVRYQMQTEPGLEQLRQLTRRKGVKSLRNFGLELVEKGLTTFDEVIRTTVDDQATFQM